MSRVVMNCPNCGAALEPIPNRKHFRCGHCETLHFPEPIGEGIVPLDWLHSVSCPCCKEPLSGATLEGHEVGYCVTCRGILLGSDLFASVVATRREENGGRYYAAEPIDPSEFKRIAKCPVCGKRTDTHPYGGGGNAVIDSCHICRLIWLDAGELSALSQFPARRPLIAPLSVDDSSE